MSAIIIALVVFAIAIVFSALFSGYETAFVSTNPIRIRHMAEEESVGGAVRLLKHIRRPDRMLAMLLVGNNIANITGTIAVAKLLAGVPARDLLVTLIVTPIFLVFGEILPKSVFRTHPNKLALALLPAIKVLYWLLSPLSIPISWATHAMFKRVNGHHSYLSPLMSSLEDVRVLVDESADRGTIKPEERKMIHSIIDLQTRPAKEIMIPRIDIQALPDTATRAELLDLFEKTGRTRIVLYHESIDEVIGIASAHDVLMDTEPENEDIRRFVRDVMHVPDTIALDALFDMMKKRKQHLAIVTDEYGGTDGLVTLEDILEVIFGEIQDEHDREERQIYRVGPDAYVIDARMLLEDAADYMGVELTDEQVETVGGWLMHVAGRIPAQGEAILHNGYKVTVLDGGNSYISKIRMDVLPEAKEANAKEEE